MYRVICPGFRRKWSYEYFPERDGGVLREPESSTQEGASVRHRTRRGPELGIGVGRLRVLNLNEVNATQMCFEL